MKLFSVLLTIILMMAFARSATIERPAVVPKTSGLKSVVDQLKVVMQVIEATASELGLKNDSCTEYYAMGDSDYYGCKICAEGYNQYCDCGTYYGGKCLCDCKRTEIKEDFAPLG